MEHQVFLERRVFEVGGKGYLIPRNSRLKNAKWPRGCQLECLVNVRTPLIRHPDLQWPPCARFMMPHVLSSIPHPPPGF